MYESLRIGAWAIVDNTCPIRAVTDDANDVTFVFGSGPDEFELSLHPTALRMLVELGAAALAQTDPAAG